MSIAGSNLNQRQKPLQESIDASLSKGLAIPLRQKGADGHNETKNRPSNDEFDSLDVALDGSFPASDPIPINMWFGGGSGEGKKIIAEEDEV